MAAGGIAVIGCGLLLVGLTASQASILFAEVGLALTGPGIWPVATHGRYRDR
jgi:hypothetical protein